MIVINRLYAAIRRGVPIRDKTESRLQAGRLPVEIAGNCERGRGVRPPLVARPHHNISRKSVKQC
jgi:hypothetical protein